MARADVTPTLEASFIDIRIDVDRDRGGKESFARYNTAAETSGIPWFAFLNADGKVIATSTGPSYWIPVGAGGDRALR